MIVVLFTEVDFEITIDFLGKVSYNAVGILLRKKRRNRRREEYDGYFRCPVGQFFFL